MNTLHNRFHAITLFLSILLCTPITAEHSMVRMTAHSEHQTHNKDFTSNRSYHDFSHNSTWDNNNIHKISIYKHDFSRYTVQNFQQHFAAHGYTENQILSQRCLYMFDDFVKFAQTYSSYTCTIQELHAELKNLNIVQKTYCIIKGTYCAGLQKRIHFLYDQLNTLKNEAHTYKTPVQREHSLETFPAQQAEYKALETTYNTHTPSLSNAIEKRVDAYKDMTESDYAMQYASKSYNLNNNAKQLLSQYGHDTTRFTQCYGNQLHQAIHQESLNILDRIDTLPSNSMLYDHQEALIDFTVAMVDYNHEGLTNKAMDIGDLCWTLLDYSQAVAEGAALGVYSAATDILNNPIQATISIIAGKQVLAYQLSKVLYNVAEIGITAITDFDGAKNKWDKYAEPLNNTITAIYNKEITVRDAIKNGTAFVVGYKVQGKLLGGLGKFCNTIKQKSINFVKDSTFLTPQEYLTTPEGLLFKATAQSNKPKQSGTTNIAANLQNSVDSKTSKNSNLNNGKAAVKQTLASNSTASKSIIRNVNTNLRSTIQQYKDHIFSKEHKADGILALGTNQETIMDSLYNAIMSLDKRGLIKEGPNQLRVKINGIDTVEIRCFIKNGEAISVNAFISDFGRIFNNFIDATKV